MKIMVCSAVVNNLTYYIISCFLSVLTLRLALLIKSSQFPCPSVLEEGTVGLQNYVGKLYIAGHCTETRPFRHQRLHNASPELLDGLPLWPSRK